MAKLMTIQEVADQLSCTIRHVRFMCDRGLLNPTMIGTMEKRFTQSEVDRYIRENTIKGTAKLVQEDG